MPNADEIETLAYAIAGAITVIAGAVAAARKLVTAGKRRRAQDEITRALEHAECTKPHVASLPAPARDAAVRALMDSESTERITPVPKVKPKRKPPRK
jgi:hypothetical protein